MPKISDTSILQPPILRNFTSPYDATVVQCLRAAGAVVAGKTNLDEFGMGSHNLNSHFGPASQQYQGESVSAGGSSGGSAVAVATKQCWAALGTDTGGSVRLPAAYTGIVGFKPSYGLVSRWGVVAYANSLDTVGVLARNTKDAKEVFTAINHHDPLDPTSLPQSTRSRLPRSNSHNDALRIGVPTDYNITELTPAVRAAWIRTLAHLQHLGHTIVPTALPTTHQALSAYYVLAPAEASSNLAKYDGVRYGTRAEGADGNGAGEVLFSKTRGAGFGDEVKRRIVLGAYALSAEAVDNYFIQAQRVRSHWILSV
ncbi:putative glutamyl-trna a [Diplodia seriata]|uniref:Putative glutamyl-trna a n=1 Tax=Diplodia seriata TaxID=420778 RepID=A0A0G2EEA7_9PEZI|nr:putative glutamyl-trna a [Diplodia seriata]